MKKSFSLMTVIFVMFLSGTLLPHSKGLDHEGSWDLPPANPVLFFIEEANEGAAEFNMETPGSYDLPCEGFITSPFGWRQFSKGKRRRHEGIDIAAPLGTSVQAPADGRVSFIGWRGGYGLTVILDHGGSLTTLYAHNATTFVKEGSYVKKGERISRIGTSGHSTGPHVHYEVRFWNKPIDPLRVMSL